MVGSDLGRKEGRASCLPALSTRALFWSRRATELQPYSPLHSASSCRYPPRLPVRKLMYPERPKVVYGALFLFAVIRPSVLFASSFLAVAAVEISVSVAKSPAGSLIDAAVRHAFGGDG